MNEETLDFSLLLASSIHDIKNSLSHLMTQLEKSPHTSADMAYDTQRMHNDLTQLLSLYQLNESAYTLQLDYCHINQLLEESVWTNQTLATRQKITLSFNCPDNLCWFIDQHLITSVLNNLIINALRYAKKHVVLSAKTQHNQLIIQVTDDGTGFQENLLKQLQDPSPIYASQSTHGLGLYFAKRVLGLHKNKHKHGSIAFNNLDDGGALCQLTLP